jgi:RNA recognition motif-containing protein
MTSIYVGNLSSQTTQDDLYATFSQFGSVERVSTDGSRHWAAAWFCIR